MHKIDGAHLQYVNNHYAKFEYKGTKTVGVTDYTNQKPPLHFEWKKNLSPTTVKDEKMFIKCAQNKSAHIQYVTNHYAKFEYKGMKSV